MQLVVAGGCDYYPGSASASPGFSFAVHDLRVAGEGDLLARIERLRRQLRSEGLLERQKQLPRPLLPSVDRGDHGRERQGPRRRARGAAAPRLAGAAGVGLHARAGPPRRARPSAGRSADLAAVAEVQVVIVARGGGSQADLLAISDETLCRTVAHVRDPRDRLGGPPHRPHAARRRGRRELLDAHPRGRGGRRGRLRARPRRRPWRPPCACATTAAGRSSRGRDTWRSSPAPPPRGWSASAGCCTSACANCGPAPAAAGRRAGARPPARRWCSSARPPRRCSTAASAGRGSSNSWRWRWPATTRSGPSNGATRWPSPERQPAHRRARRTRRGRAATALRRGRASTAEVREP